MIMVKESRRFCKSSEADTSHNEDGNNQSCKDKPTTISGLTTNDSVATTATISTCLEL